ncbi:MAG TPA: ribokinase [Terracidiphilus sp.]|nr:ribokinase [Terracidiphilus sp.]
MPDKRKPIVVVGSITMDMVSRAKQIPRVGQTVIGTNFQTTPGGKGANQAVAAARLGYPVEMVGLVGTDMYGQALLDNLAAAGVQADGMGRAEGSSGLAPIFLAENGENAIIVIPGANGKMDCARIDQHADLIRSAGMVLFQLELPLETLPHTLELCTSAGVPVMLDPAPAAALPDSVWNKIAWFTPNETEAAFYLEPGLTTEAAANDLLKRGVKGVVLKRGAEGSFVATQGRAAWVPPFAVNAIDTVGAGDCFNGAFAVALLEGRDPWAAALFANAAAAISVTRPGAQASMPHRNEVDQFMAQNQPAPLASTH